MKLRGRIHDLTYHLVRARILVNKGDYALKLVEEKGGVLVQVQWNINTVREEDIGCLLIVNTRNLDISL